MAARLEERLVKWTPRITLGCSVVVALLVGVAIYTLVHYQPKTACQTNPSGKECQALKIESDKARTARSACVITELAGLGCPALEEKRAKRRERNHATPPRPDSQPNPQPSPQAVEPPSGGDGGPSDSGSPPPDVGGGPSPQPSPPSPTPEPPAPSPSPTPSPHPSGITLPDLCTEVGIGGIEITVAC